MLGRRNDWIPARAEPLWHQAYNIVGDLGATDDFAAGLDAQWRVHIDGREPYEFTEEGRRAPLWIIKGTGHGRHWFLIRARATRGLLREVGVPCRVDPDNRERIDIDWPRAYDEHQPFWDRMDAFSKGVTARREGPLGKLLAPIEYMRLPKLSPQEQAAIDREIDAEVARQDEATGIGYEPEESRPPGRASVEHRQGMNYAMTQRMRPGERLRVRIDPLGPERVAFERQ